MKHHPTISVATVLQMGLEEKALDLAAFGLLLGLDLVERELGGHWRMPARTPAGKTQPMPA